MSMYYGPAILWKAPDVASATTITVAPGAYTVITGTTTITTIAALPPGAMVVLKFSGAVLLTNGASLVLQGGVNYTTAAGDVLTFYSEGAGVWRESSRASATAAGTVNGSGASGQVAIWSAAQTLTSDSTFAFDTAAKALNLTGAAFIAIGATPAGTGPVRLPNASGNGVYWRNAANTADIQGVYLDNNNNIIVNSGTGGNFLVLVAGTTRFQVTATTFGPTGASGLDIGTTGLPVKDAYVGGLVKKYNNITTAGMGVVPIYGVTKQKAESAADANVLTVTPPATAGTYRLSFVLSVSAASAATLGWTATWTDGNGAAQAPVNIELQKNGVALPALTFVAAANDTYSGFTLIDINNAGTAIVIKLSFAGTSFAALATAIIEQLA